MQQQPEPPTTQAKIKMEQVQSKLDALKEKKFEEARQRHRVKIEEINAAVAVKFKKDQAAEAAAKAKKELEAPPPLKSTDSTIHGYKMLAVERQLGVKRKFDDTPEMRQAAEKKVVKLEAKIERSSRDSQRSDLERGFAALSSAQRAREQPRIL